MGDSVFLRNITNIINYPKLKTRMGNACQGHQVKSLQVVKFYPTVRPANQAYQAEPQRKNSSSSLPQLPQELHSRSQQLDSEQPLPQKESVPLPPLSQKVKIIANRELQRKPLLGPPLELSYPPYYLPDHRAHYQGSWRNEQPHGKGTIYFQSGAFFEGQLVEGQVDCEDGLLVLPDGSYYRGQFVDSLFQGKGIFTSASRVTYQGDWRQGKPHGKGYETFPDGNSYEGTFQDGQKDGQGIFKWADGRVYEGQFRNGMMNGHGRLYKDQSQFFQGYFEDNMKTGKNKLRTEFGTYSCEFKNGQISGPGTFEWKDLSVFQGEFQNGLPHGAGTLKFHQGKTLIGEWQGGKNLKLQKIRSRSRSKSKSSIRQR